MVVVQCPNCKTRYRVADKLLGKRGKCKKCGEPFVLAAPADEVEDDLLGALADGEAQERSAAPLPVAPPAAAVPPIPPPGGGVASMAMPPEQAQVATGFGTYLRDVGKSLLFFTRGGDLITFVIVALIVLIMIPLRFAGCLGAAGLFCVHGWYMAYRLNVVAEAAAGESGIPNMTIGDPWEGMVLPFIKWVVAWMAALLPFVIGLVYLVVLAQVTAGQAGTQLIVALSGDFLTTFDDSASGGLVLGAVLLITMSLWPIVLLVVALGGMRALIRVDLIALTITKTLPAYVLVVLLVYAGVVGPSLVAGLVRGPGADDGAAMGVGLGAEAAFSVLMVYTNIFTMRVIGLYYHHFKQRFAWSWG